MTESNDPALDPDGAEAGRRGPVVRLRNYFLTGLVIAVPLFLTVYITWAFVIWLDSWVEPLIPEAYKPERFLHFAVPGFGLVVAAIFITLLGLITANLAGRTLISRGEALLNRMPLVRNLYKGIKQIVESAISNRTRLFNTVALIEYPRQGVWSLAFVTSESKGEIHDKLKEHDADFVTCFVPTTPTSVTGALLFVKRSEVIILDMAAEDAVKMIVSAGLVSPEYHETTAGLTAARRRRRSGGEPLNPPSAA